MKTHIALLSILSLGSAAAIAGEYGNDPADASTKHQIEAAGFDALDRNGDKKLSKTEAESEKAVSESFAKADADGDGYLSREEFDSTDWTS